MSNSKNKFTLLSQSVAFISDFAAEKIARGQTIQLDPKQVFPTYINEYDLGKSEVIGKGWELAEKPQIQLPILSKLKYDNGISFAAEINRLIFSDSEPKKNEQDKGFFGRAIKLDDYIEKSGIKISALGINFGLVLPNEEADKYINDNYLNTSKFSSLQKPVKNPNLKVSYNIEEDVTLNLTIYSANNNLIPAYPLALEQGNCVVLDANFDFKNTNLSNAIISSAKSRFDLLKTLFPID